MPKRSQKVGFYDVAMLEHNIFFSQSKQVSDRDKQDKFWSFVPIAMLSILVVLTDIKKI